MKEENVIEVRQISKSFDGRKVLDDISMNVRQNEIVCVLGISGSGKSTLFNIISGIIPPESGVVEIRNDIGYMLQKDLLMPWKTVLDNVALPLILKGVRKDESRKLASGYFEQFGLTGTENSFPDVLSGGMRQRAALLRTYLQSGSILLLDEPFSSVDAITRHDLHKWLLEVFERLSLSILLITHDIEEALLLSDRIYILSGNPTVIQSEIKIKDPRQGGFKGLSEMQRSRTREKIYRLLENQ